ncbi:MAG: ribonuclease PH [Halieaceae bacterium MED-G27]|jgi:ribonuclease PH|nr:ribonuclease PH [Halieaceae bacterium]OUT64982.1 MAG: ribonuclease PH [Cellvibrionales bacterium TMED21]PDH36625.1 MAG: ribonuclease PH [Halieaceae bacterium MED-G27]|tara:strand:+ start:1288 stop:2025 length:738 start_codon:yes stop_codon:yes gene_type:complete
MLVKQVVRPSGRQYNDLRAVDFQVGFTANAAGSVLASFGDTRVLCTASVSESVPSFLRGRGQGWLTAEYGMLPGSTNTRVDREATRGKQTGRTVEIQRLIGRSLRASLDLSLLGERTITVDCDVLQADGGTRTTAITGGCVAVVLALNHLQREGLLTEDPLIDLVTAVSVGVWQGQAILDLDYPEDSSADSDVNVVMLGDAGFVEVQGTAESAIFSRSELDQMLSLADSARHSLIAAQRQALSQS